MRNFILVVTLAAVAIQLTCAAPTPDSEKKEAPEAASPAVAIDATPRAPEAKADVGVSGALESATPWLLGEPSKGPAAAEKSQ